MSKEKRVTAERRDRGNLNTNRDAGNAMANKCASCFPVCSMELVCSLPVNVYRPCLKKRGCLIKFSIAGVESSMKEGRMWKMKFVPVNPQMTPTLLHPTSVSWGKLPTRTTQPTIGTLTSTFAGLKEDTCTKNSLAADQRCSAETSRNITARVIKRDVCGPFHKFLEGSPEGTELANLALPPRFRQVEIEKRHYDVRCGIACE
ncbi:hypothetical protein TNCV_4132841 [Trichonephila clavipes]|nr:hypothetical protein TNCV_4132841 [Trichonephila clavipes]